MELVNGVSLKDMMVSFARAGTAITPEQSIFMVLQLLQGLEYAHRKADGQGNPLRIVHCDVSPDNALVSWQGEVKLLDFGIARAATGLSNYKEGMLMGKLGYVAPEQASLDRPWDHRVDVFAAGIILYELLTKQKPFQRAVDVESLIQSRQGKVVPPSAIDERLPKELDAIVLRGAGREPRRALPGRALLRRRARGRALPHARTRPSRTTWGGRCTPVYAERIARQRAARAHDALVMKVLRNVAEQQRAAVYDSVARAETTGPLPAEAPLAELGTPSIDIDVDRVPAAPAAARPGAHPDHPRGRGPGRRCWASLAGLAVAVAGFAAAPWLRDGVLVVSTTPPGAQVTAGRPARPGHHARSWSRGSGSPAAPRRGGRLPGHRTASVEVARRSRDGWPARSTWRSPPRWARFTVESEPSGAEVRVDGKLVGRTPLPGHRRAGGRAAPHRPLPPRPRRGPVHGAAGEGREPRSCARSRPAPAGSGRARPGSLPAKAGRPALGPGGAPLAQVGALEGARAQGRRPRPAPPR